jgi:SagB-type dehydrogenase family enzyme
VSVILTARFPRSHWKYRRHQKAYATILMDAAHLSQTLYLVAADLGLGAYVTAAINSVQVDERLGIDGIEEGAIAICGFGHRVPGRHKLEPRFEPYVPRETVL